MLERRGATLILQQTDGRVFMRNVSHVHKLLKNTRVREEDDYVMDVDLPQAVNPPREEEQDVRRSHGSCQTCTNTSEEPLVMNSC